MLNFLHFFNQKKHQKNTPKSHFLKITKTRFSQIFFFVGLFFDIFFSPFFLSSLHLKKGQKWPIFHKFNKKFFFCAYVFPIFTPKNCKNHKKYTSYLVLSICKNVKISHLKNTFFFKKTHFFKI